MCYLQETHLSYKNKYRFKGKGWKLTLQANGIQRKAGVAMLISDETDLRIKKVTRDKDGHFIMKNGTIAQKDITVINIYAPNQGALKYTKQLLTELKGEIDQNTIKVGVYIHH